jgi:hypothetical protein
MMSKKIRYAAYIYLTGALSTEVMLILMAYQGGYFQRNHSTRDLIIIGGFHLAASALWPVLIASIVLYYFRIPAWIWEIN